MFKIRKGLWALENQKKNFVGQLLFVILLRNFILQKSENIQKISKFANNEIKNSHQCIRR